MAIRTAVACGALLLAQIGAAQAQQIVSELRMGVLAHDIGFLGEHKEQGADINAELLFVSPVPDSWVADVSPTWRWMLNPRINVGGDLNTAGATSQLYFGLSWTATLFNQVFTPNDSVFLGISFGPAFNNGHISTNDPDRKSLGSQVLFHPGVDIGYRINPRWSVSIYYEHSSNAHLAQENEGLNNAGLRVGLAF
jgi:lipid A 3-O-deacylase